MDSRWVPPAFIQSEFFPFLTNMSQNDRFSAGSNSYMETTAANKKTKTKLQISQQIIEMSRHLWKPVSGNKGRGGTLLPASILCTTTDKAQTALVQCLWNGTVTWSRLPFTTPRKVMQSMRFNKQAYTHRLLCLYSGVHKISGSPGCLSLPLSTGDVKKSKQERQAGSKCLGSWLRNYQILMSFLLNGWSIVKIKPIALFCPVFASNECCALGCYFFSLLWPFSLSPAIWNLLIG